MCRRFSFCLTFMIYDYASSCNIPNRKKKAILFHRFSFFILINDNGLQKTQSLLRLPDFPLPVIHLTNFLTNQTNPYTVNSTTVVINAMTSNDSNCRKCKLCCDRKWFAFGFLKIQSTHHSARSSGVSF